MALFKRVLKLKDALDHIIVRDDHGVLSGNEYRHTRKHYKWAHIAEELLNELGNFKRD